VNGSYIPRAKIVCTLGPASSTVATIKGLIEAGMNVARLNFSHGTHEQHEEVIGIIRQVADSLDLPVALLGDLQGPAFVSETSQSRGLSSLARMSFSSTKVKMDPATFPITYDHLADDVHEGDRILIDDGLIELIAIDVKAPRVRARVLNGGVIRSHKGLNLPWRAGVGPFDYLKRMKLTSSLPSSRSSIIWR
jgi:pyruvate kinase